MEIPSPVVWCCRGWGRLLSILLWVFSHSPHIWESQLTFSWSLDFSDEIALSVAVHSLHLGKEGRSEPPTSPSWSPASEFTNSCAKDLIFLFFFFFQWFGSNLLFLLLDIDLNPVLLGDRIIIQDNVKNSASSSPLFPWLTEEWECKGPAWKDILGGWSH